MRRLVCAFVCRMQQSQAFTCQGPCMDSKIYIGLYFFLSVVWWICSFCATRSFRLLEEQLSDHWSFVQGNLDKAGEYDQEISQS